MRKLLSRVPTKINQIGILVSCLCFQFASAKAQTAATNLQNSVEIYNALREYEDGLSVATTTQEQIDDVKNRMDKGLGLLEKVIKEGNAAEIRAARYFKVNFKYEYIFILGMMGQNAVASNLSKEIEPAMTGYSASDFPITYQYFDKNYSIKWENFAPTQAEYLTGAAEIYYNLEKYDDAMRMLRLSLAHPNNTDWLKYISVNKMLDVYAKNKTYLTETEHFDFAIQAIKSYQLLDASSKKTVAEYKYPIDMRGASIILENAQKNVPAALSRCGAAAMLTSEGVVNEKTLQLFELCYRNKQSADASFHTSAEAYARKSFSAFPTKATIVGISATDRMAAALSATDCVGHAKIIENYTFWKENTKARDFSNRKQNCLANEEKARKKAEKNVRRANRNFNLYAGAYILPLMKSNENRDYGGVLNFVFKKTAWEFSYLKITQNKDNVTDLTFRSITAKQDDITRWNGFYAHIHPKILTSKFTYVGPLLGYAKKEFVPFSADVTHDIDGLISTETFAPKTTQYIGMLNFGIFILRRGFGADLYCGIGATYSQWDRGNSINQDDYTLSNIVLENRKDDGFGLILRAGLTMGLNFGRGL